MSVVSLAIIFPWPMLKIREEVKKKKNSYIQLTRPHTDMEKSMSSHLIINYSQIHPALQQIPAHSTLELCLWLVSSRYGYIIWTVNNPKCVTLYPYQGLTITSKVQECCGREFAAKLREFKYSIFPLMQLATWIGRGQACSKLSEERPKGRALWCSTWSFYREE